MTFNGIFIKTGNIHYTHQFCTYYEPGFGIPYFSSKKIHSFNKRIVKIQRNADTSPTVTEGIIVVCNMCRGLTPVGN